MARQITRVLHRKCGLSHGDAHIEKKHDCRVLSICLMANDEVGSDGSIHSGHHD